MKFLWAVIRNRGQNELIFPNCSRLEWTYWRYCWCNGSAVFERYVLFTGCLKMIGVLAFLVFTTPNLRHDCLHWNPHLAATAISFPFHSSLHIVLCAGNATRPASIQWASGAPSAGVVRLERKACNSCPWRAGIMNAWNQLSGRVVGTSYFGGPWFKSPSGDRYSGFWWFCSIFTIKWRDGVI